MNYLIEAPTVRLVHAEEEIHSLLPPNINTAGIRVLSQNVTLQSNLIGKWQKPDSTDSTNNTIHFPVFTANMAGMYKFFITSSDGGEVLALQIAITATG